MDKPKSISLLNRAVSDELQAVHQYMYFHFHLADQGFGPLSMEEESANTYNAAAIECGAGADSASKQIFEQLVKDEESHFDLFEKQRDNIRRFRPSYLALQSFGGAAEGAPPAG